MLGKIKLHNSGNKINKFFGISSKKGFTLVELLIVIAILSILAAALYWGYTGYMERARDTNRKTALHNIALAMNTYSHENYKIPKPSISNEEETNSITLDENTKCNGSLKSVSGADLELNSSRAGNELAGNSDLVNGIWCEGVVGQSVKNEMGNILKQLNKDPKTKQAYKYYTDSKGAFYFVVADLEIPQRIVKDNILNYKDSNGNDRSIYYVTNFDKDYYNYIYGANVVSGNGDGNGGGDGGGSSPNPTPLTTGEYTYGEWTNCSPEGKQTRVATCNYDSCNQGTPHIERSCVPPNPGSCSIGRYGIINDGEIRNFYRTKSCIGEELSFMCNNGVLENMLFSSDESFSNSFFMEGTCETQPKIQRDCRIDIKNEGFIFKKEENSTYYFEKDEIIYGGKITSKYDVHCTDQDDVGLQPSLTTKTLICNENYTPHNGVLEKTEGDNTNLAICVKKIYTITFDPMGGEIANNDKTRNGLEHGSKIGNLPIPTKTNYNFDGWYSEQTGGEKIDENTIVNGNKTYYARWESNCPNPIYLDTNGVTIKARECAEANKEYEFNGENWYVARDKSDAQNKINSGYRSNRIVTSKIREMWGMFLNNTTFNGDISNWDTSNVTDMHSMFNGAKEFNQDISNWDTSKVNDISWMFNGAINFNQNLGNWNVSNVTNMGNTFSNTSFNHDIGNWNTGKVKNMSGMFHSNKTFNQNISNWNTSNVTNMSYMFANAQNFNQAIGNWNTSKVTNMDNMFSDAIKFNGNINNWDTSKVTSISYIFNNAQNFNQPLNNWNTSNVTNMMHVFSNTPFNQDIGNWDTGKVTTMQGMFSNNTQFNQPLNNWNTSNVTNMMYMFNNAQNFNQNLNNWITSKVTTMEALFNNAYNFNGSLDGWDTSSVKTMAGMFSNAREFNQNISFFNTSNVTNMESMFKSAKKFNQPIGNWNTNKVTNMGGMFSDAAKFNQPIGNWDTSNVTTMGSMFRAAIEFDQDIGNWDVSGINHINGFWGTFHYALKFSQDLSKWDVSRVKGEGAHWTYNKLTREKMPKWVIE